MDGRFVPNITIGPLVVDAIRPLTDAVLDTHLMIVEPEQRIADFAKAGSDIISVHCEQSSTIHLHRVVNAIKDLGVKAGERRVGSSFLWFFFFCRSRSSFSLRRRKTHFFLSKKKTQ